MSRFLETRPSAGRAASASPPAVARVAGIDVVERPDLLASMAFRSYQRSV